MTTHFIDLDIAFEDNATLETHSLAGRHGCEATLLKEAGPAGGWPTWRFTGSPEALESLLSEYVSDPEDVEVYAALIRVFD